MTMSQIDELAARAMQGLLSGPAVEKIRTAPTHLLAKEAYAIADAMAEEKKRREQVKMPAGDDGAD
ncbi:hypothetical protein [Limnoglobus roseus]|uniref:Uncharacterized protein n=1 Tax=Limnoglobus roseus TaxID=2598579 RepID=A0A5C1ARI1_9BACT|nr:hypothetical protein [Limnoglobus roseus]QEL20606.1 hypothetical protein PX52LOC_07711 [Limnoglobus roseus]